MEYVDSGDIWSLRCNFYVPDENLGFSIFSLSPISWQWQFSNDDMFIVDCIKIYLDVLMFKCTCKNDGL